jgi:glycosyltransferase involved in cell wall biosynthesis
MPSLVSVIIPTYNRANFLPYAIDSALAQTLPPLEIIVVDDVSTDETPRVMRERYSSNPLVKYFRLDTNLGPGDTRERAIPEARGDIFAFLDSDDVWLPNHLEVACAILEQSPNAVAVLAQRGHINALGNVTLDLIRQEYNGEILDVLLKRIIFHPSRLVVRKRIWLAVLKKMPVRSPLRYGHDYFQGVCLVHDYGALVRVIPDRTVWMRAHGNQSFHTEDGLGESLMVLTDLIFSTFPELVSLKPKVQAANLFHASYFLWVTGHWGEAWQVLWSGVRAYPQAVGLRDFWVTTSRLILPPQFRHWLKGET